MKTNRTQHLVRLFCLAGLALLTWPSRAAVTFFSYSDIHYGADDGGRRPPTVQSAKVPLINALPGQPYPEAIGGVVEVPRGILMPGDLINDGAVEVKYPTQWANYIADFGVNGEGRCQFPVYEGIGNHDVNANRYVFNKIKERNVTRLGLGLIQNVSPNGYHYSWDWEGIHFINVNLFPGNVWEGEADAYGRGHHPQFARDFLAADLQRNVGNSGRPVVIMQHFRPIDENWWTYSAADKYHKVLQDYNVVAILVGHQGGGVNNLWRGYHWISSNGELIVCRLQGDTFSAVSRNAKDWGQAMQKTFFRSYAESGLPAVVNNGDWATRITATGATLSGKIVHEAVSPTELTVYWGTADGGNRAEAWPSSKQAGVHKAGEVCSVEITGLQPWTTYYYRTAASNRQGRVWAGASIPFHTGGTLPAGWQTCYIGHEQRPGSGSHYANEVFTVRGSGRDIAEGPEPVDNFQFAWQPLEGDGEIIARIATAEVKSREPKLGLMLRETTEAGAKNVALLLLPRTGVRLSARLRNEQSSTAKVNALVKAAPCWVKLIRAGNTVTGYCSEDGHAWQAVGDPVTLEMGPNLLAGLAVTSGSRDESKLHTSTFDHVTISKRATGK
jgi:hypothetical protein